MPELSHSKHVGVSFALDSTDLVATVPAEQVSGDAGWVNVSGSFSLDLSTGRVFHHNMTGSVTSMTFTNVPTTTQYGAVWLWVLKVPNNGYTLSGTPTVTWVDGHSFDSLDMTAGTVNMVVFWRVDTITYAALVTNGEIPLDAYKVSFQENASVTILTEAEDVDVANASKYGDGTITYAKNGSPITARTTFAADDRLTVTCASATGETTVRVPRYV